MERQEIIFNIKKTIKDIKDNKEFINARNDTHYFFYSKINNGLKKRLKNLQREL